MNSIRQFQVYLIGVTFAVQTVHGCIIWLENFKDEDSRLIPWSLELQLCNFKEGHNLGRLNLNAIQLSIHFP